MSLTNMHAELVKFIDACNLANHKFTKSTVKELFLGMCEDAATRKKLPEWGWRQSGMSEEAFDMFFDIAWNENLKAN